MTVAYPYDPKAELDVAPDSREGFYTEGPMPGQKNFLGACLVLPDPTKFEAGIGVILETVPQSFEYALSLGHALMHFRTDGWISVVPIAAYPSLRELQHLVDGSITPIGTPNLRPETFTSGFIAYANSDGLGEYPLNPTFPWLSGWEMFDGPAVMVVGAIVNAEGDEVLV